MLHEMSMTPGRPHQGAPKPPGLLSGLTAAQKKPVLEAAELQKFRAGRVSAHSGDLITGLFLLRKGTLKYYRVTKKGDEVLLWWVVSGDIFGIGSMLSAPMRHIGTAEVVDDCELLFWSRSKIRRLATAYGLLKENAMHILMYAMTEYIDRLMEVTKDTAEQRLARALLRLCRRNGHVNCGGVGLSITNERLGALANVSAFTVSRNLKQWERKGVIQKRRGGILILSPETLLFD
jgi:CRP-like cAMP-binding protein